MLSHADIWRAIDRLAQAHGLSPSGLARQSGLNPTTFNKSKRVTREGKLRWPNTESVAKVLASTGSRLGEFVSYVGDAESTGPTQRIPVIGYAQAGVEGFFDDAGYPVGNGWDEISFPEIGDPNAFALEISGNSMEPLYRDGDTIVVSPAAGIRKGDRVVVKTSRGEVMAKQIQRRTAHKVELQSLHPDHAIRDIDLEDVAWIARVIWASQ
jgi:phage repressor protein C with HTH and peptisase S24 domain